MHTEFRCSYPAGMESNPRYFDIEIAGRRANAVFMLQIQDTFGRWFWFEAAGDSGSAAGCSGLIKAGHSDRIEAGS